MSNPHPGRFELWQLPSLSSGNAVPDAGCEWAVGQVLRMLTDNIARLEVELFAFMREKFAETDEDDWPIARDAKVVQRVATCEQAIATLWEVHDEALAIAKRFGVAAQERDLPGA